MIVMYSKYQCRCSLCRCQLTGAVGFCRFLALNALVIYIYHSSFQSIDDEEFGGLTEILKEGLMTSFATFLVNIIIIIIITNNCFKVTCGAT